MASGLWLFGFEFGAVIVRKVVGLWFLLLVVFLVSFLRVRMGVILLARSLCGMGLLHRIFGTGWRGQPSSHQGVWLIVPPLTPMCSTYDLAVAPSCRNVALIPSCYGPP